MPLSVQNFQQAANLHGALKLKTGDDPQNPQIGKAGRLAWIKSALNLGGARRANADILTGLKNAVANDSRYAQLRGEQTEQILAGLSKRRPLTGAKVVKVLQRLDKAVSENRLAGNTTSKETLRKLIGVPVELEKAKAGFVASLNDKDMLRDEMERMLNRVETGNVFENEPTFFKDITRHMHLCLNDVVIPNGSGDLSRSYVKSVEDSLASFISKGRQTNIDDLGSEEKKQAYLLASFCHQGLQGRVQEFGAKLIGEKLNSADGINPAGGAKEPSESMALTDEGDHIVLRVSYNRNANGFVRGMDLVLQADTTLAATATFTIARAELQRLAAQDWSIKPDKMGEEYDLQVTVTHLDASLVVGPPQEEE
ncbi:MAG: hypothetical protein LBS89_04795 [Zoogloeaceae bacterium]|jgi:hypothetical protein|nr:hypothetical protein [Zoogloeaceae bacterium]